MPVFDGCRDGRPLMGSLAVLRSVSIPKGWPGLAYSRGGAEKLPGREWLKLPRTRIFEVTDDTVRHPLDEDVDPGPGSPHRGGRCAPESRTRGPRGVNGERLAPPGRSDRPPATALMTAWPSDQVEGVADGAS